MSTDGDEVIWATSTTGDDFQCVHVRDWEIAQRRIAELEATVNALKNPPDEKLIFGCELQSMGDETLCLSDMRAKWSAVVRALENTEAIS